MTDKSTLKESNLDNEKSKLKKKYVVSCDDVIKNIKNYNIDYLVRNWGVIMDDDYFICGSEIYNYIFEPVLFDRFSQKRIIFFKNIEFYKLDFSDESKENQIKIYNKIIDTIKAEFSKIIIAINPPLWSVYKFYYSASASWTYESYSPEWRSWDVTNEKSNMMARKKFRRQVKDNNYTLTELVYKIKKRDVVYYNVVHDAAILEEFPKKYSEIIQKWKKERHERRLWVSKVMLRVGLPSHLAPWVCAYAVPESKIWSYML